MIPSFGKVVRRRRLQLGFTGRDMEAKFGISKTAISFIENNKVKCSDAMARKLEEAFGIATGEYAAHNRLQHTPPELIGHMKRLLEGVPA